jgi:hypothetical protein
VGVVKKSVVVVAGIAGAALAAVLATVAVVVVAVLLILHFAFDNNDNGKATREIQSAYDRSGADVAARGCKLETLAPGTSTLPTVFRCDVRLQRCERSLLFDVPDAAPSAYREEGLPAGRYGGGNLVTVCSAPDDPPLDAG